MNLGNDKALWLLFVVPTILVPVYLWCFWQKSRALKMLAGTEMLKKINTSVSFRRQVLKAFLLIAALMVFMNFLADIIYSYLDPRVSLEDRR